MFRELKQTSAYSKTISLFALTGALFGILSGVFGELFIPLAVPFIACLFIFENPKKRILSYCVPAAVLGISFLLGGIGALTALESVICAVLIAVLYVKKVSKSEVAFYLTALVTVFLVVSVYVGVAEEVGSFELSEIMGYIALSVDTLKANFLESLSAVENTVGQSVLTQEVADVLFDALLKSSLSILAVFAFAITGISLKIFSALMRRNCKYGILKKFSHFGVNNIISYFYMVVALLSFFVSNDNAFGISVINIDIVLMFVFAYMGLKYLISLAAFTDRRPLIYTVIAVAFLILGATSLRLISYVGLFVNISVNRSASQFNSGSGGQDL